MNPIVNLVHSTGQMWSPAGTELPFIVSTPFKLLHQTHCIWRRYRHIEIYTNPDNFLQLAGGHLFQHAVGDFAPVRFAAQVVMIATRILECIEEQAKLTQACSNCGRVLDSTTLLAPKVKWVKRPRSRWISPDTDFLLRYMTKKITSFILRFFNATQEVFIRLFTLSMKTMDAVESFSVSPTTRNLSLNTFFINSTLWIDQLATHKEQLLEGLLYHRVLIDDLLQKMNSPWKAEDLIPKVSKLLDIAESTNDLIHKASTSVGDLCRDLLKQGAFGFFSGIGLAKYTPEALVPHPKPFWKRAIIDTHKESGLMPLELLTWPSRLSKPQVAAPANPLLPKCWTPITLSTPANHIPIPKSPLPNSKKTLSPPPTPHKKTKSQTKLDPLAQANKGTKLQRQFNKRIQLAQERAQQEDGIYEKPKKIGILPCNQSILSSQQANNFLGIFTKQQGVASLNF